jgi:hypothetical protein
VKPRAALRVNAAGGNLRTARAPPSAVGPGPRKRGTARAFSGADIRARRQLIVGAVPFAAPPDSARDTERAMSQRARFGQKEA